MRVPLSVLAIILSCAAVPATAQTVIDVEGQKPAPPQAQDSGQSLAPAPTPGRPPESLPPAVAGRYSFNRVDNGFLRLDRESGEVAFCTAQTTGWGCQAISINRASIDKEIARLRDEIASLKKELAALREPPPPRPPADLTPQSDGKGADVMIKLPTQEDIARARGLVEDAWRRLVEMLTSVQKEIMRKG